MKSTAVTLGVASAIALAGCSSSGSAAPAAHGTPSAAASNSASRCDRLTMAINAAAHGSWHAPTETDNGTLHNCAFGPSDPGILTVQLADGMSHAGFANNKELVAAQGAVAAVSGVGDEAYVQTLGGAALVATRQGDVGVVVQLQQGDKATAIVIARAALSVLAK